MTVLSRLCLRLELAAPVSTRRVASLFVPGLLLVSVLYFFSTIAHGC